MGKSPFLFSTLDSINISISLRSSGLVGSSSEKRKLKDVSLELYIENLSFWLIF